MAKDSKIASTSSSNIRRGATEKRVVSVAIKDVERLKLKGNQIGSPPSDSWAWRKYGQKPIKGSPYPRGYYRCSSSKLCPARKQVEISRVDPTMLIITYSSEHDHLSPDFRHNHHRTTAATSVSEDDIEEEDDDDDDNDEEKLPLNEVIRTPSHEITSIGDQESLINGSEFGWFTDFDQTYCTMQESPILMEDYRINITDKEMAMIFTMRNEEDDDSDLYANLGELPECSTVLRRGWWRERWSGGCVAWPPPVEAINCLP